MKKCNCIVIYRYVEKHYEILKIMVKHKHENIILYSEAWDETDRKHKYEYISFNAMYSDVLSFLKSNNFYVHTWKMFESTWYDIDFIDVDNWEINRYPYGGVKND